MDAARPAGAARGGLWRWTVIAAPSSRRPGYSVANKQPDTAWLLSAYALCVLVLLSRFHYFWKFQLETGQCTQVTPRICVCAAMPAKTNGWAAAVLALPSAAAARDGSALLIPHARPPAGAPLRRIAPAARPGGPPQTQRGGQTAAQSPPCRATQGTWLEAKQTGLQAEAAAGSPAEPEPHSIATQQCRRSSAACATHLGCDMAQRIMITAVAAAASVPSSSTCGRHGGLSSRIRPSTWAT